MTGTAGAAGAAVADQSGGPAVTAGPAVAAVAVQNSTGPAVAAGI
ncbi:Uncharacterised protein [Mycobacterium tuberculosis]|nr:Uncharacterised protein [Mycobacterium tuberculosis]